MEKPEGEFYIGWNGKLQSPCKSCKGDYFQQRMLRINKNYKIRTKPKVIIEKKRCVSCREAKPISSFPKKQDIEGREDFCFKCKNHLKLEEGHIPLLNSVNQIDSVLREMAEVQLAINITQAHYKNKHSKDKDISQVIEDWKSRIKYLDRSLTAFIKRNRAAVEAAQNEFRFDSISFQG